MSLTRINPSGESLFALGEKLFALGENVFAFGAVVFRLREIVFGLGEVVFRLKQIVFGFWKVEFMFKEFVCHRDVTERPSKMIERFDFQIPIQSRGFQIANSLQKMRNSAYAHFFYPHHFFPILMGFTYRKCVNLGLFWVNLSKSGLGFSVCGSGLRVGTTPQGRKYCLARSQRVSPVGLLFKQATELPPSRLVPASVSPGRRWLSHIWRWLFRPPGRHTRRYRHRPLTLFTPQVVSTAKNNIVGLLIFGNN